MAKEDLKFEDYPLNVPSLKRVSAKLEGYIKDLKECGSFNTANPVFKNGISMLIKSIVICL